MNLSSIVYLPITSCSNKVPFEILNKKMLFMKIDYATALSFRIYIQFIMALLHKSTT